MTKMNTRTIATAAFASALAFALSAAPALAATPKTVEPIIAAQSQEISPGDAVYIAEQWFGLSPAHIVDVDYKVCEYDGHQCYKIEIDEGYWWDSWEGRLFGGREYTAYVGRVTGEVYYAYIDAN